MEFFGDRPVRLVEPEDRLAATVLRLRCVGQPIVQQGQRVEAGQGLSQPIGSSRSCVIAPITGTVVAVDAGPAESHPRRFHEIHIEPIEELAATSIEIAPPHREQLVDWQEALCRTGPWVMEGLGLDLATQFEKIKQEPPEELLCIGADRFPPLPDRSSLMIGFADDAVLGLKTLGNIIGTRRTTMLVGRTSRVEKRLRKSCRNFDVRLETLENIYPNADPTMAAWLYSQGRRRLPHGADPLDHGLMLVTPWAMIRLARWLTRGRLDLVQPLMVGRIGDGSRPTIRWVFPGQPWERIQDEAGVGDQGRARMVIGDPMTGCLSDHRLAVIESGEQLVSVLSAEPPPFSTDPAADAGKVEDCIGCGWCAEVCPTRLRPIHLAQLAQRTPDDATLAKALPWCIECGLCTHVCPATIPLARLLREAKHGVAGPGIGSGIDPGVGAAS